MKITKDEYKKALQEIADAIGIGKGYSMIESSYPCPERTKHIVYECFVREFVPTESTQNSFDLIREYAMELNNNGFVEFA
jgi:hypothetical protein